MRIFKLAIAACGLALAGCTAIPTNLETPEVSFVGLRAVEATVFEQRLEVRMKVANPNDVDVPVRGLEIEIELADEPFAHGVSARQFVVPARGEAEFDMHVTANAATALLKIVGGDRDAREIPYRMKGTLSTKLGILRTIPFEEKGTLPMSELLGKGRKSK